MADKPTEAPTTTGVEASQNDDAAPTSNLQEPSYDVEVQLSDLQKDTEHPLGSATTFQELGLSVPIQNSYAICCPALFSLTPLAQAR
jgi:hypothetical protein